MGEDCRSGTYLDRRIYESLYILREHSVHEKESYFYYYHNCNMCDCIWNLKIPKFELFYGIENELGFSNACKIEMHKNV